MKFNDIRSIDLALSTYVYNICELYLSILKVSTNLSVTNEWSQTLHICFC